MEVMEMFPNADLFEAYGSTEAGLVTTLRPEDQYNKLGSIGRECYGSDLIQLLDGDGNEVGVGEVGEIWSRSPMMFTEYWGLPDKTKASFREHGYFSAGDLATRDEDGYYAIVDRKDNMIITGGEHVYPTEVEKVLGTHDAVMDAAIVGLPDSKWGEAVHACVILKEDAEATPEEIMAYCKGKMAGYKKPKGVTFIKEDEMPRTATGKIQHRNLRQHIIEMYGLD
jgi:acyl-CoA synthetase (AMP-forming)/AMP-acid ligase II